MFLIGCLLVTLLPLGVCGVCALYVASEGSSPSSSSGLVQRNREPATPASVGAETVEEESAPAHTLDNARRACLRDDSEDDCHDLFFAYKDGSKDYGGVTKDPDSALKLAEAACAKGMAVLCWDEWELIDVEGGIDGERDPAKAAAAFRRFCSLGHPPREPRCEDDALTQMRRDANEELTKRRAFATQVEQSLSISGLGGTARATGTGLSVLELDSPSCSADLVRELAEPTYETKDLSAPGDLSRFGWSLYVSQARFGRLECCNGSNCWAQLVMSGMTTLHSTSWDSGSRLAPGK